MRRLFLLTAAGLGLALVAGAARAGDKAAACGSFGTTVDFVSTPSEAAKLAKKQEKLVFVLHVSGNFEDPRFT
jgi:hypothetical protein